MVLSKGKKICVPRICDRNSVAEEMDTCEHAWISYLSKITVEDHRQIM